MLMFCNFLSDGSFRKINTIHKIINITIKGKIFMLKFKIVQTEYVCSVL